MKSPTMRVLALAGLAFAARCPAGDEYSFFFTVSNDVTPDQPSATVTLWAAFAPQWYAFGQSHTSVRSDPDPGTFSDPMGLMDRDLSIPGDVSPDGDSVVDIVLFQFHWLGFPADSSNPIAAWSVTWTTDDFAPRNVPIWTGSTDFYVYEEDGHWENVYGPDFSEAQGFITVRGGCYPDFTRDGVLDLFDFLAFVNAFNGGEDRADCDGGGVLDLFDFLCFVNAFNAGC